MKRIVFIRHGESTWNAAHKFTGWTDVDLTERGKEEAKEAGRILKEEGCHFNKAYTSYLNRAQHTLDIVLKELEQEDIPIVRSWKLNERHYGDLQGKNKQQIADEVGEEQFMTWRRSFDTPPPALSKDDRRHPINDPLYSDVPKDELPSTESLKDVIGRIQPYWLATLAPEVQEGKSLIVSAHGNTIRAFKKMFDEMSPEDVVGLNIPYAIPLVYEFDDDMNIQNSYYLGDAERIKALADEVANQGKEKAD